MGPVLSFNILTNTLIYFPSQLGDFASFLSSVSFCLLPFNLKLSGNKWLFECHQSRKVRDREEHTLLNWDSPLNCLLKSKTANVGGSIMFSVCNQFFPAGSKLSGAQSTKSPHGHQIHTNPSLYHPWGGWGTGRAAAYKQRSRTNTHYLVTEPGPRCDEVEQTHGHPTELGGLSAYAPSDFDPILTWCGAMWKFKGLCKGSRGTSLLQCYLLTAVDAVREMSIISIQHMQPISTALWTLGEVRNSSTSAQSRWNNSVACLYKSTVSALCSRRNTVMKTTGNPRTRRERVVRACSSTISVPHLTTLTHGSITSWQWQHNRVKECDFPPTVTPCTMTNCHAGANSIHFINS